MIITRTRSFRGAFGDEWIDYCTKTYAGNAELLSKCKKWVPFLAPWTVAGKAARGLPVSADSVINAGKDTVAWVGETTQANPGTQPGGGGYAPPPPTDKGTSATDISSAIMKYGGILLAVGAGAVIMKKMGK